MRVCFVNSEIFSVRGGFGRLNRVIAQELIKRGIEVFALVPQMKGQRRIEQLDGMTVLSVHYPSLKLFFSHDFFRLPEADIYDFYNPYPPFFYFVARALPKDHSRIVVTFSDPVSQEDIKAILAADPEIAHAARKVHGIMIPSFAYSIYLNHVRPYLTERVVAKADTYFSDTKYFIPKVKKMHKLGSEPIFLPHASEIPDHTPVKTVQPTACFLGRFDAIKRPELFFELAKHFPKVHFIMIGYGRDPEKDREIRETASRIPNLKMLGFVSEEKKLQVLEESWVLVNTSVREGLPLVFNEACSYSCAILSAVNPDDYAQNFGYHVENDDFKSGLEYLLENDRWRKAGERGFEYVRENNDINKVIDRRIQVYKTLLDKR